MVENLDNIDIDENIVTFVHILSSVKGSVTVPYIFVYCRLLSLFAKNLRYIKLHIDRFVMIIRTLS